MGRDQETNLNILITDGDDLVEHGQDIVIRRVEIRRVGCGPYQVEVVLQTIVNGFAFRWGTKMSYTEAIIPFHSS